MRRGTFTLDEEAAGSSDAGSGASSSGSSSSGSSSSGSSSSSSSGSSRDGGGDASDAAPQTYTIGGTVSGLGGQGLILQNNGGDDLNVDQDGTFTFATRLGAGASFAVSVKTQPSDPAQTCVVSGGSGTVVQGNVSSVTINCTDDRFSIAGTVSGLAGAGLVLQNNGCDDLAVNSNDQFSFATTATEGTSYDVTVLTQPTNPSQTCVVQNGSGTLGAADVNDIAVVCTTNEYPVGGEVHGLLGSGLVLRNNGADDLSIPQDGPFTFTTPVASGAAYAVTVAAQPVNPRQRCEVTSGGRVVSASAITDVRVDCASVYALSGTASGLTAPVQLQGNFGATLTVQADGAFSFDKMFLEGDAYALTVNAGQQSCVEHGERHLRDGRHRQRLARLQQRVREQSEVAGGRMYDHRVGVELAARAG